MPELSLGSGRFGSPSPPSYGSQPPYQSKDDYEIDLSLRQRDPLTIVSLEFWPLDQFAHRTVHSANINL